MRRQPLLPGWLSALLSAAFVFSAIAVLFFAYLTVQHLMSQPSDPLTTDGVGGGLSPVGGELPPVQVTDGGIVATPTPAPTVGAWEGDGRVNIMMMGIDRRPGEAFVSRTDTIMIPVSYTHLDVYKRQSSG